MTAGIASYFRKEIDAFRTIYSELWNSAAGCAPIFHKRISPAHQRMKEEELDRAINDATTTLKKYGRSGAAGGFHQLKNTLRQSLFQSSSLIDGIFDPPTREKFSQATDDFIRQARSFNPAVSTNDIYQALRNVWILNSIQLYLGRDIVLTPSCFAYSMLYPVTDNILDSHDIDPETKRILNRDFALRLAGTSVPTLHPLEHDVFRLFEMIENEFPRNAYPLVYQSLLAIQHGQTRSVRQFDADDPGLTNDLLDISIEKGGTSVLADGYLVAGDLTSEDADFLFGYGVLLQILDDLQDFKEDIDNRQLTLVSSIAGRRLLDDITDQLLVFIDRALARTARSGFSTRGGLGELIARSCRILIFETIARHPGYFSPKYVATMETYSPVGFEYFRALHLRLKKMKQFEKNGDRKPENAGRHPRTSSFSGAGTIEKLLQQ